MIINCWSNGRNWELYRDYAERIAAPVQLETEVARVASATGSSAADSGFAVETNHGGWLARNDVLANGAYQRPRIPASSANLSNHIRPLHSHDYRNPAQLPDGAVLVVGTGQSGGQITEDLLDAGREVHLSVSACPEAPRRYRSQDLFYWLLQVNLYGRTTASTACRQTSSPPPLPAFCAIR